MEHSSSNTLVELDRRHLWHPFTQMQEWQAADPLIIDRAAGNYLFDTDGKRYLDAVSSLWVTVHGHNHPVLNAALQNQLARVAHTTLLGLGNVPSIELAARLVAVAPEGLTRVFYSDSGSTAVEIALKMAFQFWRNQGRPEKRRFLHLGDAYHGDTLGAVAVGGIPLFHEIFGPIAIDTVAVPPPHAFRRHPPIDPAAHLAASLGAVRETLERCGSEIAAFVIEPLVQGAAGMWVQPDGYLREVADLCRQHEVLLIADEVATGFGRTGTLFACEQEAVRPDFLCLAKGITGGYLPLAATLVTETIYRAFLGERREQRTFFHGHTYTGNPLACAVAVASLDLFATEAVLERAGKRAETLRGLLGDQLASHRFVAEIRQRGLMVGVELVADRAAARPFAAALAMGSRVCLEARRRGVILRPLGDVVVLMPPLSIETHELEELVSVLATSIEAAAAAAELA